MADYLKRLRDQDGGGTPGAKTADKDRGKGYAYTYKPNKNERKIRSHIWDRYLRMRDDPMRKEAEMDWEQADKKMRMWRPDHDPDDWRADIRLPDAFAAVQTHLQETIGMKIRPSLKPQEGSDTPLAFWANGLMTYNMDRTGFDLEVMRAINCSASRGTAFTIEEYLYETRTVKDPVSVVNGVLQYKEKERVDKDDTFTMFVANERIFIDEAAETIELAEDYIHEERLRFDTFKTKYGNSDTYINVDEVVPCGSLSERTNYFDNATDSMEGDIVQVLRYYNKMTDSYQILANTVVICDQPIPFKHKELNVAVWNYYPVEGRIWGLGIPKIISPLQEEREAIRNLSLDRQKMHLNKMFLVSDLFDIDEDEATTRPHGFINVNSGGMPLDNVIRPLEYGDVPGSSVRMDDQLRDDEKRVTGIDDRSQGVNMGGTATEAAILTEQSQKRINLINTLTGMATIERMGKLKWSNIEFFWPAPRVEMITEDNKEREKKIYRTVSVDGKSFEIVKGNGTGKNELKMNDITGSASFKLDGAHAAFFDNVGDVDIRIQWDVKAVMPQAIRQSKVMEMFQAAVGNPFVMKETNIRRAWKDVLMEHEIDPKTWMTDGGQDEDDQMAKAQWENMVMSKGLALDPTQNASEMHTMVHLWYTESEDFKKAVAENPAVKDIFTRHILGENQNGPGEGAAGQGTPLPGAGMNGIPGAENLPTAPSGDPNAPVEGQAAAPVPGPGPQAAAPPAANPVGPVANGGQVTNEMAPLR
jgi:hypothetical protein